MQRKLAAPRRRLSAAPRSKRAVAATAAARPPLAPLLMSPSEVEEAATTPRRVRAFPERDPRRRSSLVRFSTLALPRRRYVFVFFFLGIITLHTCTAVPLLSLICVNYFLHSFLFGVSRSSSRDPGMPFLSLLSYKLHSPRLPSRGCRHTTLNFYGALFFITKIELAFSGAYARCGVLLLCGTCECLSLVCFP